MDRFGVGQSVPRKEDDRFVVGKGRYLDDICLPGQAYGWFLRSPHAHAAIKGLNISAAESAPGVVAVLTAEAYRADGLGALICQVPLKNKDGSDRANPLRWPLAADRVRHVGDTIALVVADSLAQAKDAGERIAVDYEALPAVSSMVSALEPGAPQIWEDAPGNVCFDWELGDRAAVEAAFASAAHVTKLDIVNNRLIASTMEPRGAVAAVGEDGRYRLYLSTQGAHGLRDDLCKSIFKIPTDQLRVITPDVGGGFGMKIFNYPEYPLVLWAAIKVGRPVKWMAERSDAFMTDTHGRDHLTHAELALDAEGKFLAIRVSTLSNMGAYVSKFQPFVATGVGNPLLPGSYTTPAVYAEVKGVFTNTVPVDAYRGAGRPEANFVRERLIDQAARELALGRDEVRRRNFIPPEAMPYQTPITYIYDSGDFARNLRDAQAGAGWAAFEARRAESGERGRLRGIGVASYLEACAAPPEERATVRIDRAGQVTVLSGNQSNGQGHETVFAQLVVERLGVPFESVTVVQGDTDVLDQGAGTGGSRSLIFGGGAVLEAASTVIEKGREIASDLLEVAPVDLEFGDGAFRVAGTDQRVSLADVAAAAADGQAGEAGDGQGLEGVGIFAPESGGRSFPNGCHVCELEVDEETGHIDILRYTVVDDFGTLVNPMLVEGQVHGGTVQGIGQALYEGCVYDDSSGQLLTGSFMDYCLPRAADIPAIDFSANEIPCLNNPLGAKGCGEAGATGATPAVISALLDALAPMGVDHIDMPATPERVWRAIRSAKAGERVRRR